MAFFYESLPQLIILVTFMFYSIANWLYLHKPIPVLDDIANLEIGEAVLYLNLTPLDEYDWLCMFTCPNESTVVYSRHRQTDGSYDETFLIQVAGMTEISWYFENNSLVSMHDSSSNMCYDPELSPQEYLAMRKFVNAAKARMRNKDQSKL